MPRQYKRKTDPKYRLEDLKQAVEDVKNKQISLGKAASLYSVPKTTIFDYLKKNVTQPKTGRKPVFSDDQEKQLYEYILQCSNAFYGLTIDIVRKIAFDFAEENKLKHNFKRTDRKAGKDWYYGFIARHPDISLRKPEATSLSRITAFNNEEIKIFFNNLETLQQTHHFAAEQMYNVDETGITNVQRNSRILAHKGQKQVGMATSAERGTTTTVVCAFSALGNYIPPFFIFKRKRMNPLLLNGANNNMIAAVSDSGWINEQLFVNWIHHFIAHAKPTKERPFLLVLDNHESHVSLDCYQLCRQSGIVLLSLPPHTSHRMQPLDLTFFGPLKSAYNRECDLYMAQYPGRRITQYEVAALFTKAFNRVSNIEKAANGFRAAGIIPMNPHKFDDELNIEQTEQQEGYDIQMLVDQTRAAQSTPLLPSDIEGADNNQSNITTLPQSIPLSEIVNCPTIPKKTAKKNARKKHSTVLTSTPMKDMLDEKEYKKKKKELLELNKRKCDRKTLLKNKAKKNFKNDKTDEKNNNTDKDPKKKRNDIKENEYFCIYCCEKYESPPTEDWVLCYRCNLWAHEKCTSGESTTKGFICDICIE